jgi:hypothetical protein
VGTIGVDAVGIGLAAFGLLNPLFAAFIHVASELAFILNSARLLPSRTGRDRSTPLTASAVDTLSAPARSWCAERPSREQIAYRGLRRASPGR